jgi:uncharacterized SAM-binding protein YcdF (DUF218 family)
MTYTHPLLLVSFLLVFAGLLQVRRSKRTSLLFAGVAMLFFLSWPPFEWLLSRPLEGRYPVRPFESLAGLQAIVVFSEAVSPPTFERPYAQASSGTAESCNYAAWMHKTKLPLPILVCGGSSEPMRPAFSAAMRELLRRSGVPDSMIWTEEQSQNTHENSAFGAVILRSHAIRRVALVVDARSMPRAAASLRKQGIDVVPSPSRFRQWEGPSEFLPGWQAIRGNEDTLHETLGLVWYRLRGWI